MEYPESKTAENLRRALEEELQTSAVYRLYARQAKAEGYLQMADLFLQTAENELEHASLLLELIHDCIVPDTAENLRAAVKRENENPYERFAEQANRDGCAQTANLFHRLGGVEKSHGRRFKLLLENMENGAVFHRSQACYWICRVCGALVRGAAAPEQCPLCGLPQSCFSLYSEDY